MFQAKPKIWAVNENISILNDQLLPQSYCPLFPKTSAQNSLLYRLPFWPSNSCQPNLLLVSQHNLCVYFTSYLHKLWQHNALFFIRGTSWLSLSLNLNFPGVRWDVLLPFDLICLVCDKCSLNTYVITVIWKVLLWGICISKGNLISGRFWQLSYFR